MQAKKNLGLMQMKYKNVYLAYVSMRKGQTAFKRGVARIKGRSFLI